MLVDRLIMQNPGTLKHQSLIKKSAFLMCSFTRIYQVFVQLLLVDRLIMQNPGTLKHQSLIKKSAFLMCSFTRIYQVFVQLLHKEFTQSKKTPPF